MSRYEGRPLLRLLECYVLAIIDELKDSQRETLQRMEPKLAQIYGKGGSWMEIIRSEMGFSASLPKEIYETWQRYCEKSHTDGIAVDPEEFAIKFIDQHFPSI